MLLACKKPLSFAPTTFILNLTECLTVTNSGILLHASQAAFYSRISNRAKALLQQHRRRLVLLVFYLCISLFSVLQFVALLLLADTPCQVAVRFTLLFDQGMRASAIASGVCMVCDASGGLKKVERLLWTAVFVARIILGAVVLGFTRGSFIPGCFPEPQQVALGYLGLGYDAGVWVAVLVRIVWLSGFFAKSQRRGSRRTGVVNQWREVFLVALALLGWTLVSIISLPAA